MEKQSGRPTLATVASRAGVSIKTASRVLNGEKHVAADTASRVEAAARDLGFHLNSTARRLRAGGRSPYVGLVLDDLSDPVDAALLDCIHDHLRGLGLRPVVSASHGLAEVEAQFLDDCLGNDVAGICVLRAQPAALDEYRRIAGLWQRSASAIVSLDPGLVGPGIRTVSVDDHEAGRLAARQLVEHGHISIGVIGDRSGTEAARRRLEGVREELGGHPEIGWRAFLLDGAHDRVSAKNVVAALLGSRTAPTALITLSATVTVGAVDASRRLDQWPALVGIDDFPTADLLDVTVVVADLGMLAAEAVAGVVPSTDSGSSTSGSRRTVPVHVIARGSGEEAPNRQNRRER